MAKINLRESLGRLDLLTDNKYDLRNTYDCSNISNNKKKVLAEAISNNVSAKQLYNILNEDYDSRYEANSYYGKNYSGLEDNLYTDSYSELEEWVWEKIHGGGYIEVSDRETGKYVRLNPDRYDFESDDAYGVLDDLSKINESLNESEEQLYKVVLSSGATKFNFESALYKDEAEGIVDYYDGRWIDENGFEWDMYVEEDDESTEHAMVDDSYDMEESYFAPDGDSVEDMVTTGSGYGEALKNAKKWCDRYKEDYIIIFYGFPFGYLTVSENNYNNYPDEYSGGKIVARVKYEDGKYNVYKECLTEASYGGAYDIEDDMFFTKEEIVELADEVCDLLKNKFGYDYETVDVGMESTTELYLCVQDIHGVEEESTFRIDMRKIRKPSDLFKYAKPIAGRLAEKFEDEYQYYNFDESLKEAYRPLAIGYMILKKEIPNHVNYAEFANYDEVVTAIPSEADVVVYPHGGKIGGTDIAYWQFDAIDSEGKKTKANFSTHVYSLKDFLNNDEMELKLIPDFKLIDKYPYLIEVDDDIEESLAEDMNSSNLYLYHATDSNNVESILKKGLLINPGKHNWEGMYTDDAIFLALDANAAEDYAYESSSEPEEVTVLKVKLNDLDPNYIRYDWNNRCEYHTDINSCAYYKNIPGSLLKVCDPSSEPSHSFDDFEGTELYDILYDTFNEEVETNLENDGYLQEDTVKQNGKWVNKGKEGTHGKFKTKKAADAQRKAMFANGYKAECLEESDNDGNSKDEVAVFTKGIDGKSYYHGFMNRKEADKHYPDRLKEDIDDEIDFETDLDDGEVEEGNVFFADGTDWVWEERIAGPIHLDFDNWAVWSARESVDIRDFIIGKNDNGGWNIDKEAYIEAVKSKPIVYFIVDEDTGFIDWGPVENEIEAKDFLNDKQDDWENDDYYGESLKESFDDSTTFEIYYDDIDGEKADYYFEVPYIDVLEFLANYAEDEEDAPQDEEELLKYIDKNFDRLYNEYEYKVLDHFYEDAEMKYQSDMADRAEYMRDTMRDRDI